MSIIELIMSIDDTKVLAAIEKSAQQYVQTKAPNVWEAARPMRSNVSLEQIMEEQNYQPISFKKFRSLAKEVALDDSLDDLLSDLKP